MGRVPVYRERAAPYHGAVVVLAPLADVLGAFPTVARCVNTDLKGATAPVDRIRTAATGVARRRATTGDIRDRVETAAPGPPMMATTAGGDE